MLTVIIPSYNEENYISACLEALIAQEGLPPDHATQVIVAANGCRDNTVQIAESFAQRFSGQGFSFSVLDIAQPGKTNALNTADKHARFENRAYLDADVVLSPRFLAELIERLDTTAPLYIGGTVHIPRASSWVTRAYAKIWTNMPFVRDGVPGIGFYAFTRAGRQRWQEFPEIVGDDRFVRLQFSEAERIKLAAAYQWPLPEGFINMVNAKRRWSEGNREVAQKFPDLMANDSQRNTSTESKAVLFRYPVSGLVFVAITVASKGLALLQGTQRAAHWRRGRS